MPVLYLTYDGLLEQLGQSQVLQYLLQLAERHHITLLSFEKPVEWSDTVRRTELKRRLDRAGIRWIPLTYHKWPSVPATAFDILCGFLVGAWLVARYRIGIVHARSYVPSVMALGLRWLFGVKFIFDMRGLWVDARAELGGWSRDSAIFRLAKWLESRFLLDSDVVVSLTQKAVDAIRLFPCMRGVKQRFEVITTCTNLELFFPSVQVRGGRPFTLGYVGSVGTVYLLDEVCEVFKILREKRPGARLRIVNRIAHDFIRKRMAAHGIGEDEYDLKAVEFPAVGEEVRRMDAGVSLIRADFSRISSTPTRLGEFLACGLPVLGNAGVGDVEEVLEGMGVGVVVHDLSKASLEAAVDKLILMAEAPSTKEKCLRAARQYFSLEKGVGDYSRIYFQLEAA